MKFQKFPIFHLWVCVTDSPRCPATEAVTPASPALAEYLMQRLSRVFLASSIFVS